MYTLRTVAGSGLTISANIVDLNTGKFFVKDTALFENFTNSRVSLYYIPMSGVTQSRGYYLAAIPSGLPAGNFDCLYIQHATNASGSLADTILSKEKLDYLGNQNYEIPVRASGYTQNQAYREIIRHWQADVAVSGTNCRVYDTDGTIDSFTLNTQTNPTNRTRA